MRIGGNPASGNQIKKMKPATINKIESNAARFRAEMTNATNLHTSSMTAYLLRSSVMGWMDKVEAVEVTIDLRPGYSSTDHLFDRLAAKVIDCVHGKLFASEAEVRKAANSAPRPECAYDVTISPSGSHQTIPSDLEDTAEAIREKLIDKETRTKYAKLRKEFAALGLSTEQRDDYWVIVSSARPYSDPRYTYCVNIQPGNDFVSLQYPAPRFASEAEALEKIAAYKKAIGA